MKISDNVDENKANYGRKTTNLLVSLECLNLRAFVQYEHIIIMMEKLCLFWPNTASLNI